MLVSAVLVIGLAAGIGIALALSSESDSDSKSAATSARSSSTPATKKTTPSSTTSGSTATTAARSGGGGPGTTTPTTTPPKTTPTTLAPTTTTIPKPKISSASVNPEFVVCPKFGGETNVTVTWDSANATYVQTEVVVAVDPGNYMKLNLPAQGSVAITIPCNGKQQQIRILPFYRASPSAGAEVGDYSSVFVGEGIEGT